jgi:single-strand DNA-binding protein
VRDPELRFTREGKPVCNFRIASNGRKDAEAEFIDVVAWGETANAVASYKKKGHKVLVEGRIVTGSYVADDGTKRYYVRISASSVQFLDDKCPGGSTREEDVGVAA